MADLPPPPRPRLNPVWADLILEEYPYSKNLRDNVEGEVPPGKTREEMSLLAQRYNIYLARNRGHKLTFDQILNLDLNGQLGGAKKRKSKKTSKKVSKKKSSKKSKGQVGGAKKRKSKKSSKESSKKNSKKTSRK